MSVLGVGDIKKIDFASNYESVVEYHLAVPVQSCHYQAFEDSCESSATV